MSRPYVEVICRGHMSRLNINVICLGHLSKSYIYTRLHLKAWYIVIGRKVGFGGD